MIYKNIIIEELERLEILKEERDILYRYLDRCEYEDMSNILSLIRELTLKIRDQKLYIKMLRFKENKTK